MAVSSLMFLASRFSVNLVMSPSSLCLLLSSSCLLAKRSAIILGEEYGEGEEVSDLILEEVAHG